jgi:hypothetical protein
MLNGNDDGLMIELSGAATHRAESSGRQPSGQTSELRGRSVRDAPGKRLPEWLDKLHAKFHRRILV